MKMKKILTEWRRFVTEGVSNHDIRQKEIEKINSSREISDKEAQKLIASVYIPMSLVGHKPIGAEEFYQGRILDSDLVNMLDKLSIDVSNHEETGEQTTRSEYFTIETVGELSNETTKEKIRLRSNVTSKAEGIFDNTEDLQRRIFAAQRMISQGDFNFGKLSTDFDLGMPSKGGHHRGPDSGDGGIQLPGKLTPAETAEFEKMMQLYVQAHGELTSSIGKEKNRAHYEMLQSAYEKQRRFYQYMYELWNEKKGPMNNMTVMYRTAAQVDDYGERLQDLIDSPEMQTQFAKEKMSDMSTLEDDFARGMTTTDKAEAEKIFRKLKAARDKRSRLIRQRMRTM